MRTQPDQSKSGQSRGPLSILLTSLAVAVALCFSHIPQLAQAETPVVEELFEGLARSLSQSLRSNSRQLTPDDAVLRVSRQHVLLNLTNAYDPSGIRFLAIRLGFKNTGSADITVDTSASRRMVGNDEFPRAQTQAEFPHFYFDLPDELSGDVATIQGTSPITIPPNRSARAWLVFGNLPRTRELPPLILRLETSGGKVELELSRIENEAVTSQLEQIGPSGRIGIARVGGEINVLNAAHFSKLMVGYAEQGVSRLVVALDKNIRIGDELTQEWLVHGPEDDNDRLQLYPQWSGLMRSVVFINVPGQSDETEDWYAQDEADAVQKVTRDFISGLASATLRREIRTGHPLFRRAILLNAGDAMANDDCDVILEFLKSPDREMQNAAIRSLRSAVVPQAATVLEGIVRQGASDEAALALQSLNSSQRAESRQLAMTLATDAVVQNRIGLAKILRTIGPECDERWLPFLKQSFQSGDSVVRETALPILLQTWTESRLEILQAALADKRPAIRDLAFHAMVIRRSAEEHPLFVQEALRRIQSGEPDERTLVALREIRDPSVLPQILKWIDAAPQQSLTLVNAYAEIGGSPVLGDLIERYPRFSSDTQSFILRTLLLMKHPECRRLAVEALQREDTDLDDLCHAVLIDFGDTQSVAALRAALEKSIRPSRSESLARSLGAIGSPEARQALESILTSPNLASHHYAKVGKQVLQSSSPVEGWISGATSKSQSDDFEGALQLLRVALEVDPNSAKVYNNMGFNQLHLARRNEAKASFEQGLRLDPESHSALTGLAICLAIDGRCDEAIQMVDSPEVYRKFYVHQDYLYNVACVYGRSLEHVLREPESAGRTRKANDYRKRAFQFLNSAITGGFSRKSLLLKDADLNSLRDQPAFQRLTQKVHEEN